MREGLHSSHFLIHSNTIGVPPPCPRPSLTRHHVRSHTLSIPHLPGSSWRIPDSSPFLAPPLRRKPQRTRTMSSQQESSGAAGREAAPEGKDRDGPGPGGEVREGAGAAMEYGARARQRGGRGGDGLTKGLRFRVWGVSRLA